MNATKRSKVCATDGCESKAVVAHNDRFCLVCVADAEAADLRQEWMQEQEPSPAGTCITEGCESPGFDDWELNEGTVLCCDCNEAKLTGRRVPQEWVS